MKITLYEDEILAAIKEYLLERGLMRSDQDAFYTCYSGSNPLTTNQLAIAVVLKQKSPPEPAK